MTVDTEKFEKAIGYTFKDKNLIYLALSHSSYVNENKLSPTHSYERLEFLGDSIVNMLVGEKLYKDYPKLPEGELTRIRAIVVCESTFYHCIKKLNIGQFMLLGRGEEMTGGRERVSILADLFEAITGAIYLDGSMEEARNFALNQLHSIIIDAINGTVFMDYKTQLQETLQKNGETKIIYTVIKQFGPDHDKEFIVEVKNNDTTLGTGQGKSKKEAEQIAAKYALKILNSN
jgi:ribonuclease-3